MAEVTIVLATYNQPFALKCAVQCILLQSFTDWRLLVVGDSCEKSTEEIISSFQDPRIEYVNLPTRCGEQSGPNSAGMVAAKTKYIALLNQDDVWLPDHLERAVSSLEARGAAFYCAGAVVTGAIRSGRTGDISPVFLRHNKMKRSFEKMFSAHPDYMEPASAWVFTKDSIEKIGFWAPAATLYRTPLEDWLLRFWRSGQDYIMSDEITVIKCNAVKYLEDVLPAGRKRQIYAEKKLYDIQDTEQRVWLRYLQEERAQALRTKMADDIARYRAMVEPPERFQGTENRVPFMRLVTLEAAKTYWQTGHDSFTDFAKETKLDKGGILGSLLQRRTGEMLPQHRNWDDAIAYTLTALLD